MATNSLGSMALGSSAWLHLDLKSQCLIELFQSKSSRLGLSLEIQVLLLFFADVVFCCCLDRLQLLGVVAVPCVQGCPIGVVRHRVFI